MGISFADIVEKSRTVKIDVRGGHLSLTYDPSALSPAKISQMNKKLKASSDQEDDEALMAVSNMFCGIVKGWDLTGPLGEDAEGNPLVAEGEAVPVEPEYVAWLPSPILSHLIEQVGEDSAPKTKKRK